jgi:hypothetical protein
MQGRPGARAGPTPSGVRDIGSWPQPWGVDRGAGAASAGASAPPSAGPGGLPVRAGGMTPSSGAALPRLPPSLPHSAASPAPSGAPLYGRPSVPRSLHSLAPVLEEEEAEVGRGGNGYGYGGYGPYPPSHPGPGAPAAQASRHHRHRDSVVAAALAAGSRMSYYPSAAVVSRRSSGVASAYQHVVQASARSVVAPEWWG